MASYLASAGDDICFLDTKQSYSVVKQLNPHNDANISCISWSPDNLTLCSCSTSGDKVAFSQINNDKSPFDLAEGEKQVCAALNSTGRYVVTGGNDGRVHVWDLWNKKHKKEYKGHSAKITSLSFNGNDTDIASASSKGEIILFNVVSSKASSPLTRPHTQAVRQLIYSKNKKSLLAAASDDGAVNLWDTNCRTLVHSFSNVHKAPACGLVFSPLNDILLISVGLDKRIIIYDVHTKAVVKTIMAESPLTSVDLMHDGATLAVGSTRGKIYIYNLRKGSSAIHTIPTHKASVQALKFHNPVRVGVGSTSAKKNKEPYLPKHETKHVSSSDILPVRNVDTDVNANSNNGHLSRQKPKDSFYDHSKIPPHLSDDLTKNGHHEEESLPIYSPLRNESTVDSINVEDQHDSLNKVHAGSHDSLSVKDEVFSPERGDSSSSIDSRHSLPKVTSIETVDDRSWITQDRGSDLTTSMTELRGSPISLSSFDKQSSLHKPRVSSSGSESSLKNLANSNSLSLDGERWRGHAKEHLGSKTKSAINISTAAYQESNQHSSRRQLVETVGDSLNQKIANQASASLASDPRIQPVQAALIRSIVEDVVEDFQDAIHQDILSLSVDIFREFQIHKMEIQSMLQQYSVNAELLEEVERLREENKQLKLNF